ncbi:hypothetical protein F66182_2077 [Fusarium sp. NRRL 66182]|nr:hypothetical protein F66182_2077 [Fusarium sp. NRRL 66182]
MTVTEVGCMFANPGSNIMDESTPAGKTLNNAWEVVTTKPGGPQRVYWGVESAHPLNVWGFFDFASVEQHRAFADKYGAEAVKDIPKICTHPEFSKHLKMIPSSRVLESPLTEIMLAYFPQDIPQDKQEALSAQLSHILANSFESDPDVIEVARGWGLENDFPVRGKDGQLGKVLMGFVGWRTTAAQANCCGTDEYKEAVSRIKEMEGCVSFYGLTVSCQHMERA